MIIVIFSDDFNRGHVIDNHNFAKAYEAVPDWGV